MQMRLIHSRKMTEPLRYDGYQWHNNYGLAYGLLRPLRTKNLNGGGNQKSRIGSTEWLFLPAKTRDLRGAALLRDAKGHQLGRELFLVRTNIYSDALGWASRHIIIEKKAKQR